MKDYSAEINTAVITLGELAYEHAREHCPVRTGRLKRSITLRREHNRAQNADTAVIGTFVSYAPFVEFGGINRHPKPFLGGAAEFAKSCAATVFELALGGG
ncbi:MAG: HK97 gp10 family phage protein [Ruminiclostridium sp.]|nr:HK97 gp10 family phage protein [Ruminiclostridium sp.]